MTAASRNPLLHATTTSSFAPNWTAGSADPADGRRPCERSIRIAPDSRWPHQLHIAGRSGMAARTDRRSASRAWRSRSTIRTALAALSAEIDARVRSESCGIELSLPRPAELFSLIADSSARPWSSALHPNCGSKYHRLYAVLQDDITRKRPASSWCWTCCAIAKHERWRGNRMFGGREPVGALAAGDTAADPHSPRGSSGLAQFAENRSENLPSSCSATRPATHASYQSHGSSRRRNAARAIDESIAAVLRSGHAAGRPRVERCPGHLPACPGWVGNRRGAAFAATRPAGHRAPTWRQLLASAADPTAPWCGCFAAKPCCTIAPFSRRRRRVAARRRATCRSTRCEAR